MDDPIHRKIEQLVSEEHELWQLESAGRASADSREQMDAIKVSLDQCWDLLRQRRALRAAHLDPDVAALRPPTIVEGYEQ